MVCCNKTTYSCETGCLLGMMSHLECFMPISGSSVEVAVGSDSFESKDHIISGRERLKRTWLLNPHWPHDT